MPMPDGASRQRLALLGIDVWLRRDREDRATLPVQGEVPPEQASAGDVRIRMASGSGDWLLVQRQPWSGEHEKLLADITAVIGAERCRFGQWAVSESAGIAPEKLPERGIRQVLAFGQPPRSIGSGIVHRAPGLDEIAADAEARRRLWRILSPLVDR